MKSLFCSLLIGISIVVTSCHTTKKSMDTAVTDSALNNIHRRWMLKTIDSVDDSLVLKSKAFIDLTNAKNARVKAGCNSLSFGVKSSGNDNIEFTQGPATLMFCGAFIPAEHGLISALKKTKSYSVEAHRITFKDEDGKTLITGVAEDWD